MQRIQGRELSAGITVRKEGRNNSASEIPSHCASRFAAAYSSSFRLICVRIMMTTPLDLLSRWHAPGRTSGPLTARLEPPPALWRSSWSSRPAQRRGHSLLTHMRVR